MSYGEDNAYDEVLISTHTQTVFLIALLPGVVRALSMARLQQL